MVLCRSREVNSSSALKNFPTVMVPKGLSLFTRALHWTILEARCISFTLTVIFVKFILILSSYLCLSLPLGFQPKLSTYIFHLPYLPMSFPFLSVSNTDGSV
jgi:hypothetical protein